MPRLTLDVFEEYPYFLIGICSSDSDYRLCWSLNRALGLAMKMEKPVEVMRRKGEASMHSLYTFVSDYEYVKYRLVENKTVNGFVLPEVAKADYLLIIDKSEGIDADEILRKMKNVRQVLLAFLVDISTLKTKQNILLTA